MSTTTDGTIFRLQRLDGLAFLVMPIGRAKLWQIDSGEAIEDQMNGPWYVGYKNDERLRGCARAYPQAVEMALNMNIGILQEAKWRNA